MTQDTMHIPPFSTNALFLFRYLRRHGGSMRIAPLLRGCSLDTDAFVAAANELNERRWININWRAPRPHMPPGLPERFREVDRVTTTRFGRFRYPVTWATW